MWLILLHSVLPALSFPSCTLVVAESFQIHLLFPLLLVHLRSMLVHVIKERFLLVIKDSLLLMLDPLDFPRPSISVNRQELSDFSFSVVEELLQFFYPSSSVIQYRTFLESFQQRRRHCTSVVVTRSVNHTSINAAESSHLGMVCFLVEQRESLTQSVGLEYWFGIWLPGKPPLHWLRMRSTKDRSSSDTSSVHFQFC